MNIEKTLEEYAKRLDKLETQCEKLEEEVKTLKEDGNFGTFVPVKCVKNKDGTTSIIDNAANKSR